MAVVGGTGFEPAARRAGIEHRGVAAFIAPNSLAKTRDKINPSSKEDRKFAQG